MTEARRHDTIALSVLALLPALLFFNVLRGLRCLYLRDLSNFHYPGKKLLREIVLRGEFPSWNPYIGAGQPLAANPQHEVFYPLTWLILLPDYTFGFHLLIVLHVVIALFAMYFLLRSMNAGPAVAVLGAISYGFGGVVLSMLNLLPFLFSTAWLPLTILFTRTYLRDRKPRDFALATLFLSIQLVIGEPVTALQTGILLGMFAIWRWRGRALPAVALISLVALLVAAVQVFPAIDHFRDSVRAQKPDLLRAGTWSLPFERLAEMVNPDLLGDPTGDLDRWRGGSLYPGRILPFYFSIYSGLLLTIATVGGLLARARGWGLVCSILLVSIVLAAGSHTPLLRMLYDVGIGGTFRFPEKFFLMAAFTIVVFGARTIQKVLDGNGRLRRFMIGISGSVALLALAIAATTQAWSGWLFVAARASLLVGLLASFPFVRKRLAPLLLAAFVLADLLPIAIRLSPTMPASFYSTPPRAALALPRAREEFRIFHYAALDQGSRDAAGYFGPAAGRYWAYRNMLVPLTPATYDLRMVLSPDYDATTLVPTHEFTLAALQLAKREPRTWIDIVAAMSNIRYVCVYRPFASALAEAKGNLRELQPVQFIEGRPYPRYYFATEVVAIRDVRDFIDQLASGRYDRQAAFVDRSSAAGLPQSGSARVLAVREQSSHARIDVACERASFLVMSVTPHQHWRVTIDGVDAQAVVTNVGYQGVAVPAGRHVVEMDYRNPLVAAGGGVSIAAILALTLVARRRNDR